MSARVQKLVEGVAFIFAECTRLSDEQRASGRMSMDDFWFNLPHPSGTGFMTCGRIGFGVLKELAAEAGKRAGMLRRVQDQELQRITGKVLVHRFLVEGRNLNVSELDRALNAVGREAKGLCKDVVHFFPCHLMASKEPDAIRLGPVTFINKSEFRRDLLKRLKDLNAGSSGTAGVDRRHFVRTVAYYRNFGWLAEVRVGKCDWSVSRRIAEQAALSALDCLHLIFGAQATDSMSIGGPDLRNDWRGHLFIAEGQDLDASLSLSWFGQSGFEAGWSKVLLQAEYQELFDLCGTALETAVDPDYIRPFSRRFLDAAQWFGEACRDKAPWTRVVKYVTALERALTTEDDKDICRAVAERSASFRRLAEHSDQKVWKEKARKAYDLRSRLLHGSISPLADEVRRGVHESSLVAQGALLGALRGAGKEGLLANDMKSKTLAEWFDRVHRWAQAADRNGD